ncbi:MAG: hypothetical protein JW892_13880 [Anaerolineae bacterium]|nr:hypothetical protein [Anaerolineae bacterium]
MVRGGAFNNDNRNVRCAYRNNRNPNNRNRNQGFRVVLSIFFMADAGIAARGKFAPFAAEVKNSGAVSWPRHAAPVWRAWPGA